MKKLLILALTSAVAAASNAAAESWFSANSSGPTGAEWSSTPVVENNVISVDTDVGSKLTLSPTATKPSPEVKTVVTVEAAFTAASDYSSLVQLNDAKTALTVAKDSNGDSHYYYWDSAESDPNVNKWKPIEGLTPTLSETPVTVTFELDNSSTAATTARITIDDESGKTVTVDLAADTTLSALAFAGTGTLKSVDATVTPAYAKYNNTRYATTADAVTAKGNGTGDITMYAPVEAGKYDLYDNANNKVYYTSTSGNTTTLAGVFPDSGDGSKNNPWEIGSLAELKAFQVYVATNYPTAGKYFQQTANITLDAAWPGIGIQDGKDIVGTAAFDKGAFKGTYDGGDYTVSNFQMVDGLDYCGFFNSVSNATIRNLKISYKDGSFAKDMVASKNACGATFVGVAKGSTLQYLTANPKDNDTKEVSCTKGFGGIVGYLNAGSLVENCTNNVDLISTKNNNVGGIAMIRQNGASCTIKGCKNTGTLTTTSNEHGAIVGYADNGLTIEDCENTAECKMLHHQGDTVTVTGTNKGYATVASYTGNATPGLNFATVDGNVATFVADNALAAGKTYKVMATGATATATLANAGDTISFEENLFTPTYAIAAASGVVAPSTSGKVTTYTASTPVTVDGESTDATLLVSVPQNCKASQLIDTSNRASNDVLRVLNKTTNKYYQWEYDGKGGWTPNNVVQDADNVVATPAADTVDLTRGEAVWVTRTVTSEPIKLNAVYTDDPVEVAVSSGYNLVAPALKKNETTFALSSLTVKNGSFSDTDMIVIPGAAAPINCVRKNGDWKIYKAASVTDDDSWGGIATGGTYVTPDSLPAGKGFFFVTKEAKTLSL